MKHNNLMLNVILFVVVLLACFTIAEVTVRSLGEFNIDGQFFFNKKPIKPFTNPHKSVLQEIEHFEQRRNTYLIPDKYLGWTIKNNSHIPAKLLSSNNLGLRGSQNFSLMKPNSTTRIALFGDSFVHGDDVYTNETWAYMLDKKFAEKNIPAEIMNFGVPAFGNDQAYLRWNLLGKNYNPDIILIGFQAENCLRNVNMLRSFYSPGYNLPFSKPRFILKNESLMLVNFPTLSYLNLPREIKQFKNYPLKQYEEFYLDEEYEINNPLYASKLFALLMSYFDDANEKRIRGLKSSQELCFRIFQKFVEEASVNASVFIVHLPLKESIHHQLDEKAYNYQALFVRLRASFEFIDPAEGFVNEARKRDINILYARFHHSPRGNRIVAETVYPFLEKEIMGMNHEK